MIRPTTRGAVALGFSSAAFAQKKVTIQLKWVTQAQFAGYYVAKDKGFYKEAGLDVTIKPRTRHRAAAGCRRRRGRRDRRLDALRPRRLGKGVPLVNIAQPFKKSGMMLTCRAETGH